MATIGERLRRLRKAKHITQGEFGASIGVAQTTISRWEKGDEPPSDYVLERIGEVLGCTRQELVPDSDLGAKSIEAQSQQASQEIPELSDAVRTIGLILPDLQLEDPKRFLETIASMRPGAQELVEQYVYMLDSFLRDQAEKSFRGFYPVPTHIDTRVVGKPPTERGKRKANGETG